MSLIATIFSSKLHFFNFITVSLTTSLTEPLYSITQNNGRFKLTPRFSHHTWVEESSIDSEFGRVTIRQDDMTHFFRIKHAIEQSYAGLLPISTFLNLVCKFLFFVTLNLQNLAHLNNVHNIDIGPPVTSIIPLRNLEPCFRTDVYHEVKKQTALKFVLFFDTIVQQSRMDQIYSTFK